MASFFSTLDPETQNRLIDGASQALGAQHRAIGRNTANASRVREYLASNDAYAKEQLGRISQPHEPASENGSGVGDFQRQNDAFMKLQGDNAPEKGSVVKQGPSVKSKVTTAASGKKSAVNVEQDEATNDLRRDKRIPQGESVQNVAQDQATSPFNRDRTAQTAAQTGSKDDSTNPLPYILAAFGARAIPRGRSVSTISSSSSPIPMSQGGRAPMADDIIDAQWSDAKDIPDFNHDIREDMRMNADILRDSRVGQEQRKMLMPPGAAPENVDFTYDDIMNVLGHQVAADDGAPHGTNAHDNIIGEALARDAGDPIEKALGRAGKIKGKVPKVKP